MPVGVLLQSMSSRELSEWMAYDLIEPIGEGRADMRAGIVASTIANVNRDATKRPEPFTPIDFVPRWAERIDAAEQADADERLARQQGAKLVASILTFQARHGGEVVQRTPEEAEAARAAFQREFEAASA